MKKYYTTKEAASEIAIQLCQLAQHGSGDLLQRTQEHDEKVRGWVTKIGDAIFNRDLIGTCQGIKIDPAKLGSAIAVVRADIRADDLNAWLNSIRCPVQVNEQAATAAKAMPAAAPNITEGSSYNWKDEAVKIANQYGQTLWDSGSQQITARGICGHVSEVLAQDSRSHGQKGVRVSDSIRSIALKGWRFIPNKKTE